MIASGKDFSRVVGNLFLAITILSAFACLIRSDYNFTFALFGYYVWTVKRDPETTKMLIIMNAALVLFDLVWMISIGGAWTTYLPANPIWNSFRGLHIFVLVISVINATLKLVLIGFIWMTRKSRDEANITMIPKQEGFYQY